MNSKMTILSITALLFCLWSCKTEEAPKIDKYNIQPYELKEDNLFVLDTINGLFRTSVTKDFIGIGVQHKTNQFPEYLSQSVFRSFAFVGENQVEVTLRPRNTNLIETTLSTLQEGGTLSSLPDFYYDADKDYFYQCFAVIKGKPGPANNLNIIYRTFATGCGGMVSDSLAKQFVGDVGHLDTLLVSFVQLPFRKTD